MAKRDLNSGMGRTDPLMASNSGGGPPPIAGSAPKALQPDPILQPGKPKSLTAAMIPGADSQAPTRPAETQTAGSPMGINPKAAMQMLREKREY